MMNLNVLKKLSALALALAMTASLAACGGSSDDASGDGGDGEAVKYLIGISQYGQHGSLDNCREGFLQGLEQAGLVEGTDFEVDYQNANFDDNQTAQIGQTFSAENVDLMVGIATNAAVACFNAAEDKDIPVIFTAITDPVGAHLDEGNITGTSDALPVAGQLELIRALQPEAETIGIVYTTSEANSVYSISVYEELAADYGFTIDARHPGKDRRGRRACLRLRGGAGEAGLRGRCGPGLRPAGHPDRPDGRQGPHRRGRLRGSALRDHRELRIVCELRRRGQPGHHHPGGHRRRGPGVRGVTGREERPV